MADISTETKTIHWIRDYNPNGEHRSVCGCVVTTEEIREQKFEGVFRFQSKVEETLTSKNKKRPENYCSFCWEKAAAKTGKFLKVK